MLHRLELARNELAPGAARAALGQVAPAVDPKASEDARLLISELVTNSVMHGGGEQVTVLIDADRPGILRCEVIDEGTGFTPRGRGDRVIGGWGLDIVERLATSWGVREGSTHVWFELPLEAGPDATSGSLSGRPGG
jgi:anti-sigma regulatory factor (Ser/Thr protein kinase)